jgi:predicted nucleic acid-binding protein
VVVIDSSVIVEVLVGQVDFWRLVDESLAAPQLIDAEVGHALRRKVLVTKELAPEIAVRALEDLTASEIHRYDHMALLSRAWQLRENVSFYDALYVALAEMLDVPLVTLDTRLAGAPGVEAVVEVLPMGA